MCAVATTKTLPHNLFSTWLRCKERHSPHCLNLPSSLFADVQEPTATCVTNYNFMHLHVRSGTYYKSDPHDSKDTPHSKKSFTIQVVLWMNALRNKTKWEKVLSLYENLHNSSKRIERSYICREWGRHFAVWLWSHFLEKKKKKITTHNGQWNPHLIKKINK